MITSETPLKKNLLLAGISIVLTAVLYLAFSLVVAFRDSRKKAEPSLILPSYSNTWMQLRNGRASTDSQYVLGVKVAYVVGARAQCFIDKHLEKPVLLYLPVIHDVKANDRLVISGTYMGVELDGSVAIATKSINNYGFVE